jgi:sn-glycerol 3-phosphate transport system permease protein
MNRFFKRIVLHFFVASMVVLWLFPIYIAFVASTHPIADLMHESISLLPGHAGFVNYHTVLFEGVAAAGGIPIYHLMLNSLWMAIIIALGKVIISIFSAYALVFFDFRGRQICFVLIFLTLMLPVEVRILPTFSVVANLHLLNTFSGLCLPLIASATATFLFRQFFLTIPDELIEAARMDGAGPWRCFIDVVLPLSYANLIALFIIMFIYGWNQFLWPLIVTTHADQYTVVMGIEHLANVADQVPAWHYIMCVAILALLPPLLIVVFLQRFIVKGLIDIEK